MISKVGKFPRWWPIPAPMLENSEEREFPSWWPTETLPDQALRDSGLWVALEFDLDNRNYKPRQRQETIDGQLQKFIKEKNLADRNGSYHVLKNGLIHSYFRLSDDEYWIWERLDGQKTVRELVDAYRESFGIYPLGIASLLDRLRDANMLSEPPRRLYSELATAIEERRFSHKLSWLARTFFTREFAIKGLDDYLDRFYRKIGRYLFSVPIQVILLLISSIGTYFFIRLIQDPSHLLLQRGSIVELGLLVYIPIVIHEFAHAITAKHVGCEVHRGGVMLYYGLPAAFVDTTDAWMFGKRERLAITWAGPYTGFIIAGTCALFVHFLPKLFSPAVTVQILQLALFAFAINTFNLLPLLKFDGYYLLADALEISRLRERSMEFLTRELSMKIKTRRAWTGEDKIFLGYGILSFLSTFYFTWAGLRFWDEQTSLSISQLLKQHGGYFANARYVGVIILAMSFVAYSLVALSNEVKKVIQWLGEKGFFSTRRRAAFVIIVGIVVLVLFPWLALPKTKDGVLIICGLGAFALTGWMTLENFISMRGSIYRWIWLTVLLGLIAGFANFVIVIKLNIGSSIWGYKLPTWTLNVPSVVILYMNLLFILTGRLSRDLKGSWREFSLFLLAVGMALYGSGFAHVETLTVATCLMLGGLIHWRIRPKVQFDIPQPEPAASTREKVTEVFNWIKKSLLSEVEQDFGELTRSGVTKKKGEAKTEISFDLTGMIMPGESGRGMAVELEELLGNVERVAGIVYTRRILAYLFDKLHWELREITEDYILRYVPHAQGLSKELSKMRNDMKILLQSVPSFTTLKPKDLDALCRRFQPKYFARNVEIIRAGEPGMTFYLIRTGRVEVLSLDGKLLNQLGRGDYFGEGALLATKNRNASIRTLTSVEVLELNKNDFDQFISTNVHFDEKARSDFRRLAILREIPLFEQFNGNELMTIAKSLERLELPQGEVIFKQGQMDDFFYIVDTGAVSVEIDSNTHAKLEAGEYFGEIALIMDSPRTATVIAQQPTVLLRLQSNVFRQMLHSSSLKHGIERTGSRRMRLNKEWLNAMNKPNNVGV